MNVCSFFLLFRIFAYTISSPLKIPQKGNADLALRVDLVLEVKENSKVVNVAKNYTVNYKNKIARPDFRASSVETFTGFMQEVANVLNTYEDTAFADFFDILDEEIRKYHYRGCKFYELTENYEFRSLLAEKLDLIKRKSVPVLKAEINEVAAMIKHETYNNHVKELLDYINSLYREDASEKFRKVLTDLTVFANSTSKMSRNYLVKIIRDGVRAIVLNHYTGLNMNARRELKKEIAIFLKKIKTVPSSSSKPNLYPYTNESSNETIKKKSLELSPYRQQEFNSQSYLTQYMKEISYKTTEKPEIMFKSDLKGKKKMLVEGSTGRLPTIQPATTPELRLWSSEKPRRSIAPPMPGEELSIDVFDREERQRQKSLAKSNSIATAEHRMKVYIKRIRNLQNKVNKLKKIDENNKNSRMKAIINGYKVKDAIDKYEAKDKKHKKKRKESKNYKKTKVIKQRYDYEAAKAHTEKSNHKVRETKTDVKKTNLPNADEEGLKSNEEKVINKYGHAYVLEKQKKVPRSKSTKATKPTKTDEKHKYTTDAEASVNIRVRRCLKQQPTAENNAGNTTVNDNHTMLTKTTPKFLKKVGNITLNVTVEVKQKRINNTANDDYVTNHNPTRRYRRVLEFFAPPPYDQPFDDHTLREGLHPASMLD